MKFEEFLKSVTKKISPEAAFGLARDVQLKAIRKALIDKGLIEEFEFTKEEENQFSEMAKTIENMPVLPIGSMK